jgi:hypothetical protein
VSGDLPLTGLAPDDAGAVGLPRPRDLAELLAVQRHACRSIGSELYERILGHCMARVGDAGPIRDLLVPHERDPFGSALPLRFLGAVHRIVLEGRAPELAAHYPSVGGTPGPDVEHVFEAVVAVHVDELARRIDDGVQTNEVGRSASLAGALLEVARLGHPLRLLEVGSSAGLNLRWDHYRYDAGDKAFGDPASPVRFDHPWTGRVPDLRGSVEVDERRGCDRAPVDATTAEGRLTLRSFIWPDLDERFRRLDGAIEVARRVPATVDRADGPAWLVERLAEPAEGRTTVVMHSIVLQYVSEQGRRALLDAIADAGRRAAADAPLAWVRMEPGRDGAEVRLTVWPGGPERLVAISGYHGPPIRWLART